MGRYGRDEFVGNRQLITISTVLTIMPDLRRQPPLFSGNLTDSGKWIAFSADRLE
jgi:hypothetical protein